LSTSARAFLGRYTFVIPDCFVGWLSLSWPGLRSAGVLDAVIWQAPGPGAPAVVVGGWSEPGRVRETMVYLSDLVRDAIGSAATFGIT
jgi:hypothetical protein